MKRGSTLILKGTVIVLGLVVLALCVFGVPRAIGSFDLRSYDPILLSLYVPAIPFFVALRQAMKLLGYIDRDKAFSQQSVDALKYIKYCALAISALFAAGMPYTYYVANKDDAPGVIAIGLVIMSASFVIAMAAAVFQSLLQYAVDIKDENDLTV